MILPFSCIYITELPDKSSEGFAQEVKEEEGLDLFKAASLGRLQTAAKLIKSGVNIHQKDEVCDHLSIFRFCHVHACT